MQIFFLDQLNGNQGILQAEEAHHCINVLRHDIGDTIHAIDGAGGFFKARIIDHKKSIVKLEVTEHVPEWGEHSFNLHLGISPLRLKDRFEWMLEKTVELGVTDISPMICQHSQGQRLPSEKRQKKLLKTALKQCKRSRLPSVNTIEKFEDFIQKPYTGLKVIAQANAEKHLSDYHEQIKELDTVNILIGPEGDFSEAEIQQALSQGWQTVHLGDNRLRAETAAIHLLSAIKYIKKY